MKKNKWNPEDWQGRSKEQVDGNYQMLKIALTVLAIAFIGTAIYKIFVTLT